MKKPRRSAPFSAVLLAALALCLSVRSAASAASAPSVSAKSAVVLAGGCAVYEKNADMKLPIASTTKLMTAILALENCRGDECVYIRPEYCNVEGSSMYLAPGERRTGTTRRLRSPGIWRATARALPRS